MAKRLDMLEKLALSGAADSFALYGLAMEYRKEGRVGDSLAAFERLRAKDADYLPMYLMAGQVLSDEGRSEEARAWLTQGIELATRQGNSKAHGELSSALEACE